MVGWHHLFNGHEFEQTLGDSEGPRRLACYTVHGVAKSQTWLSDWTTTIMFLIWETSVFLKSALESPYWNQEAIYINVPSEKCKQSCWKTGALATECLLHRDQGSFLA